MAYSISWMYPERVIYIHYSGHVKADQIRQQYHELHQYASEGTRPLYVVTHTLEVEKSDIRFLEFQRTGVTKPVPGIDTFVIVLNNSMFRFLIAVAAQVANINCAFTATAEEAVDYLLHRDPTLKPALLTLPVESAWERQGSS